jgi:hypothetical protein
MLSTSRQLDRLRAKSRAARLCSASSAARSSQTGSPSTTRHSPAIITRSARCAPHRTSAASGSCAPEKRSSSSLLSARFLRGWKLQTWVKSSLVPRVLGTLTWGGEAISRSQCNCGYGGDSGPSRCDPGRRAIRPKAKLLAPRTLGHCRPRSCENMIPLRVMCCATATACRLRRVVRLRSPALAG